MKIAVRGFPPETTEEEIREALEKYGAVVEKIVIEPAKNPEEYLALIEIDTDETGCQVLADAINGTVWKDRRLRADRFMFTR